MKDSRKPQDTEKRNKRYHVIKMVESLLNGKEDIARKHLSKLVSTRVRNKIQYVVENETLV